MIILDVHANIIYIQIIKMLVSGSWRPFEFVVILKGFECWIVKFVELRNV